MPAKRPILIAILCGAIIALLAWYYLSSLEEKYRQMREPVPVLIAKGYIPQGTVLKEQMVQVIKVPKEYIQPGALSSTRELGTEDGKSIYTTILPLLESEQITISKLASIKKEAGLALTIPEGKVAISIPVDKVSAIAGLIKPGNKVNVLVTFDYDEKGHPNTSTITLFQNVPVLAVDRKIVGGTPEIAESKKTEEEIAEVVTLALTPEEAAMVIFACEKGRVQLSLRALGDENIYEVPRIGIKNIISGAERITPAASAGTDFTKQIEKYTLDMIKQYSQPHK